MLIYLQVAILGQFFPPLALVLGLPALVAAILIVLTRWRWAALLGVLYWILMIAANRRHIPYNLTHPEFFTMFAFTVFMQVLTIVGMVAGAGATLQNYRAPTANAVPNDHLLVPRWFLTLLWLLAGLCLGAILVGAIPRTDDAAGVSPEALVALPAVRAANLRFDRPELRVRSGEVVALRLENRDNIAHSFEIDEFKVHVPISPDKPSLAVFTPDTLGTYTFYCGLPSHRNLGMVGTLIVEP
jgi:plastocyanin